MNINYTKTLAAYTSYMDAGKPIEPLTEQVHDYVLLSGFLDTHGKSINKAVLKVAERHDELLVQTFIGKLRHKLPRLRMGVKLSMFEKERANLIAAALIAQVYIDNESYLVDTRVEPIRGSMPKKFRTGVYLQLGGSHVKNILRGIEVKPGVVNQTEVNGWKLNSVEKKFLRTVASIPFQVSDVCTKELLMKGYSLKVDWNKSTDKNGRTLPEDPIVRKKRFEMYADTIIDQVKAMPCYYLPMKFDSRGGRVYYEAARLDGMRVHGKEWEVHMNDAAVPFELTEEDERVLNHVIYVTLYGRVSIEDANERITPMDVLEAHSADPMEQTTEKDFGIAIRLNKAAKALTEYRQGKLSRYMFGYDFTNSGLLMSSVSFRSEKMMAAANISGEDYVVDSHTAFGEGLDLDLDRDSVKKIHMGLMHGSTLGTIADVINEVHTANGKHGDVIPEVTEACVKEHVVDAYGSSVLNIPKIAEWGSNIVGNEQSVLRWTMPDGFSASSRAYLKSVPINVYSISASHKAGYTSHVVVTDMPWVEDNKGYPIYGKDTVVGGVTYQVTQKKRGLFAGITHGNDAYMLRYITDAVLSTGRPILLKHDDFIAPPSAVPLMIEAGQEVFHEMFEGNFYQMAVDEIIENSSYDLPPLELVVGISGNTIYESTNFLMP